MRYHATLTSSCGSRVLLLFGRSGLFALREEGIVCRLLWWLGGDTIRHWRLVFVGVVVIIIAEAFVFAEEGALRVWALVVGARCRSLRE
jgi:hypothetical protein